ncbi:hypothetical protein BABINDRAFT_159019 [Babjeviella inositovora NRRL Y-12698]|uniref:Transcription factor Iwr1 domain-containing protein n=1 Tax=Babjeviella inositovora NRRL Y-12698 TaxID=984486 RepID=A0A1E3QXX8_9ASCO|nr:uncharacterized protein BABINDRAFT_159019 [Babjeviella inositovora NRRL Y-12698]ODQ82424.1 hypothetical protein BABINDRAFT_159019 [Babjeviella inositovora NRRL Y-12698]
MSRPTQGLEVVRIKRKRGQDPLQALILEGPSSKKSKKATVSPNVFFKLARTDDSYDEAGYINRNESLLESSTAQGDDENVFYLSKKRPADELPDILSEMIGDVLLLDSPDQPRKRKLPTRRFSSSRTTTSEAPTLKTTTNMDEYVYDVYYRDKQFHDDLAETNIGYIKLTEGDDGLFNLINDESDTERVVYSDDEDSNAEDFYRNDYPENEDASDSEFEQIAAMADHPYRKQRAPDSDEEYADNALQQVEDSYLPIEDEDEEEMSDDEDDVYEISHNRRRFSHAEYLETEGVANPAEFDNLYEDFYDETAAEPASFLDDGTNQQMPFKRNKFFATDEDDEMAIHRDRIFGKLERMINERS